MSGARVAVLQFPGVNCEAETVRALARAGLEAGVFGWTRPPRELADHDAYVLPGGFSWQDRVRAGALAAKHPLVAALADEAARGKPVLGICNGAQVLVEAGLVPGGDEVTLALARNRMPDRAGYYARWVHVRVEPSACLFTTTLAPGEVVPLPMAHGEGRFIGRRAGVLARLRERGQTPLRYATREGADAEAFPDNPNGSEDAVAAVCNAAGNVLAIMPHPERAQALGQVSRSAGGAWGTRRAASVESGGVADAPGPGMFVFEGLARHLGAEVAR